MNFPPPYLDSFDRWFGIRVEARCTGLEDGVEDSLSWFFVLAWEGFSRGCISNRGGVEGFRDSEFKGIYIYIG